ncbi:MAG: MFS transporter [Burkholderiales bacterium]|nr:MFS transporter [Burkholderiales bacterium]
MKPKNGLILYLIALCFTALCLFIQVLPINTAEHFQRILALSPNQVIKLTSVFFIFYSILQIPGGIIFDRFGIKIILPAALLLTTIGSTLYMLSTNPYMLVISRILTGVGTSTAYITGIFLAVKEFPRSKSTLFISLVEAASTVSPIVAANFFNNMLIHFGWYAANSGVILFSLILFILAIVFLRRYDAATIHKKDFHQVFSSFISIFKNRAAVLIFCHTFFVWSIMMSFAGFWLKNYMINMHHFSVQRSLNLMVVYWISFSLGGIIIGFLIKELKQCKTYIVLLSLIGFLNFATLSIPALFNYPSLLLIAVLGGIYTASVMINFTIIAHIINHKQVGTAIAINNTFLVLGGMFGQIGFGEILGHTKHSLISVSSNIEFHYYNALLMYPFLSLITLLLSIVILVQLSQIDGTAKANSDLF